MKISLVLCSVILFACMGCTHNKQTVTNHSERTKISDDSLLTLIQLRTFNYFWEGAEPFSGMACERIHINGVYPENDKNIITTGGSGFGFMSILVGIERGFITREEAVTRFEKNIGFLKRADHFHGAWPHWLNGETGKVKPFGEKDDGADLVETSFMFQGLLAVRQYFKDGNPREKQLAAEIDKLWREVDYEWFTNGEDVIHWHWSPNFGWDMNSPVRGFDECMILYVMAASSPTHPVKADAYHKGWARNGLIKTNTTKYGFTLTLKHNGAPEYCGPLYWAHYSYLGLDPRKLNDQYANYWEHNKNMTLINRQWCIENPQKFKGYGEDCWGLTSSYSTNFYAAHAPGKENDQGVISPTAAISSIPYTPEYSMQAIRHFYYSLGDRIWGEYGFYDAFSEQNDWYPKQYLAIDQGPEIVMIENYRSALLWNLFMSAPEIQSGLTKLGFSYN